MMDIRLEGVLGKKFGGHYQLKVKNVNEAIRSLCRLVPGFREFLTSAHEHGIYFQVKRNNSTATSYDEMGLGCSEFVLVPVITGAFFGGRGFSFGLIALGIVLLALAMPGIGLLSFGPAGTISAGIQTAMITLGTGLLFTGIAGLFAPGMPEEGKQEGSEADDAVFGGGAKTADAGTPIPLLYGTHLATNMPVVSSYIEEEEGYLLCIVSEGPVDGFPNGSSEDIYFNGLRASDTAIQNIQVTDGTQTGVSITGVKSAGFHLGIGTTLQTPRDIDPNPQVVRSFTQTEADELKVRLYGGPCFQLKQQTEKSSGKSESKYRDYDEQPHDDVDDDEYEDADGNFPPQPLQYTLRVTDGNGDLISDSEGNTSYDEIMRQRKARKLFIRTYDITNKPVPISISLTRLDKSGPPDPVSHVGGANSYNFSWTKGDVQLVSADVTWAEKLIYPGTALVGIKFAASEFTQMPTLQVLMKGLKVPVLNKSLTVRYAHSDNPAYVLLDLLTNPRYGLGRQDYTTTHPTRPVTRSTPGISMDDIDLSSFKAAADYCNERVNGKKRFTFNAYIQRKADALDLVRSVASSFNGSLIYAGGYLTLVIDRPSDQTKTSVNKLYRLYSQANVIQETNEGEVSQPCFNYEGSGRQARTSVVEVSWVNPSEFYKENKEVVEDVNAIQRYGYNHKTVRAMGCTDREQARRLGRYVLASNILNTETVSFSVATEGAMLLPGDICLIGDPLKTDIESSGRIKLATSSSISVDRELTTNLDMSQDWYVYTYGPSGIAQRNEVKSVSGTSITIEGSFSSTPSSAQMFMLVNESDENTFRRYRVQSVKEGNDGTFDVVAILYVERKFEYIDDGDLLDLNSGISYGSKTTLKSGNPKIRRNSITFTVNNTTP